jgi:hypothetical protein
MASLSLLGGGFTNFLVCPFINITGPGAAVVNTTTPTSLFAGATFRGSQSLTIPARTMAAGDRIEIELTGTISCIAGANLTITVFLGGTAVMQGGTGIAASATTVQWVLGSRPTRLWFPAVGTSGACAGFGEFGAVLDASAQSLQVINLYSGSGGTLGTGSLTAINTAVDNALDVQVTWSETGFDNSIQLLGGCITKAG